MFDERWIHARVLQVPHDVLGVSERAQQRRHVRPEFSGQVQDVVELSLPLLGPLADLLPEGTEPQEARMNGWRRKKKTEERSLNYN